jgi:hypothetical protein
MSTFHHNSGFVIAPKGLKQGDVYKPSKDNTVVTQYAYLFGVLRRYVALCQKWAPFTERKLTPADWTRLQQFTSNYTIYGIDADFNNESSRDPHYCEHTTEVVIHEEMQLEDMLHYALLSMQQCHDLKDQATGTEWYYKHEHEISDKYLAMKNAVYTVFAMDSSKLLDKRYNELFRDYPDLLELLVHQKPEVFIPHFMNDEAETGLRAHVARMFHPEDAEYVFPSVTKEESNMVFYGYIGNKNLPHNVGHALLLNQHFDSSYQRALFENHPDEHLFRFALEQRHNPELRYETIAHVDDFIRSDYVHDEDEQLREQIVHFSGPLVQKQFINDPSVNVRKRLALEFTDERIGKSMIYDKDVEVRKNLAYHESLHERLIYDTDPEVIQMIAYTSSDKELLKSLTHYANFKVSKTAQESLDYLESPHYPDKNLRAFVPDDNDDYDYE